LACCCTRSEASLRHSGEDGRNGAVAVCDWGKTRPMSMIQPSVTFALLIPAWVAVVAAVPQRQQRLGWDHASPYKPSYMQPFAYCEVDTPRQRRRVYHVSIVRILQCMAYMYPCLFVGPPYIVISSYDSPTNSVRDGD